MRTLWAAAVVSGVVAIAAPAQGMPPRDPPPAVRAVPCDPGMGKPEPAPTCPDRRPLIGDVVTYERGVVTVQPLTVLWGDAARRYGARHGIDISNDYHQFPDGSLVRVRLEPDTVCTGAIRIHYRRQMYDHAVPCRLYARPVRLYPVTSALWFEDGRLVQLSELYRP